jgi:osmotically-inducible protein OsmY
MNDDEEMETGEGEAVPAERTGVRRTPEKRDEARTDASGPAAPGQIEQEPARGHDSLAGAEARSDKSVRSAILKRLETDDAIDPSRIDALVEQGRVTLVGTVDEYADKRRVTAMIEAVAGVRAVIDQLRVTRDQPYREAGGMRTTDPHAGPRRGNDV